MTQAQVATNHAAVRALLAAFERAAGHEIPDGLAVAARAATELLAYGYRRVEAIPARGTGGSDEARTAARQAAADAVAAAKARRLAAVPVPMATQRQLTALAVALAEDGTRERQDRLDWCSALVGRQLASTGELTRDEASRLIDAVVAPPLPAEPEQDGWPAVESPPTAVDNPVDEGDAGGLLLDHAEPEPGASTTQPEDDVPDVAEPTPDRWDDEPVTDPAYAGADPIY